jgi:hypothetical protein
VRKLERWLEWVNNKKRKKIRTRGIGRDPVCVATLVLDSEKGE